MEWELYGEDANLVQVAAQRPQHSLSLFSKSRIKLSMEIQRSFLRLLVHFQLELVL
jgi:hypothetical protein